MAAHWSCVVFPFLLMLWSMTDSSYIWLRGSLELYLPTGESMVTTTSVKCRVHGQWRCLPLSLRYSPQLHLSSPEEGTNGLPAVEYSWMKGSREQAGPCWLLSSQSRQKAWAMSPKCSIYLTIISCCCFIRNKKGFIFLRTHLSKLLPWESPPPSRVVQITWLLIFVPYIDIQ